MRVQDTFAPVHVKITWAMVARTKGGTVMEIEVVVMAKESTAMVVAQETTVDAV